MTASPLHRDVARSLEEAGISLWGVALCPDEPWPHAPALPRAVSLAVALAPGILGPVADGPTAEYNAEYLRVNAALWAAAQGLAGVLRAHGAIAEPLWPTIEPAFCDDDDVDWTAAGVFAHKTAATQAGLGWIGKTAIFVSPVLGPWLRLTTVFTDGELTAGEPVVESSCARCRRCVDACPAGAGRDVCWRAGMPREELYDAAACMRECERNTGPAGELCGICLAVCPFGRRLLRA